MVSLHKIFCFLLTNKTRNKRLTTTNCIYLKQLRIINFSVTLLWNCTRGAELFKQNRLTSYTLSADRSKLWATFLAKSKRELVYLLDTFPLTPYMQYTIYTLAFNEQNSSASIPVISLN
jgi:hypothetical protein